MIGGDDKGPIDDKGPMQDPRSTRDVMKAAPSEPSPATDAPEPASPAGAATRTIKPDQEDA